MIMWRNLIRKLLTDRESTDELYGKLRGDFTKLIGDHRSSLKHEMAQTYDDMLHLVNILDALTINTIEDRERTEKLIQSLLESQEERDKTIRQLQEDIRKREKELAEFKQKYKLPLDWADDYIKHASQTSPE